MTGSPVPADFRCRVEAIAANRSDGAITLALRAAEAVSLLPPACDLETAAQLIRDAQPAMAPLVHLAEALRVSEDAHHLGETFRDTLLKSNADLAARALDIIPQGAVIATHSSSASVLEAIQTAHQAGRGVRVYASESQPGGEGRALAAELLNAGISADVVPDAEIALAVQRSTLVVTGADWISPEYVFNKLGTAALCAVARSLGRPAYCFATRLKILPFNPPPDKTGLFEPTPKGAFTAIVTEDGPQPAR